MPFIQSISNPKEFDLDTEYASFKLGFDYYCWFCGETKSQNDEKHTCLEHMTHEESLANPYTSHLIEEIFKIALKNKSFDLDKVTLLRGEDDPLVAVVLSMIFGRFKEKRPEWLDRVPNVTPEIRQKMIDF